MVGLLKDAMETIVTAVRRDNRIFTIALIEITGEPGVCFFLYF